MAVKKEYTATIRSGDTKYTAKGETLLDAFNNLKIDKLKTEKPLRTFLIAERNGKKVERVFNMPKTRRFAMNEITRSVWAKLLSQAL